MILDDLNPRQKEAVMTTEGPLLILAGAGSGKTRVLTSRIAYLLETKNIRPPNILAVTFTNKAAQEMKERVKKLIGLEGSEKDWKFLPYMGTFHSICARILRKEITVIGFKSSFTIYDETDKKSAIKKAMKEAGLSFEDWRPQAIGGAISKSKNLLITPKEYESRAADYYTENIAKVYIAYENHLRENNALDFDDLINGMIEVFEKDKEILTQYQNLFKYILIDEYQDTNKSQYRLVQLLAESHENICVVGDDAQSIYRFRMADIQNILNFEKDFKKAKVIYLDQGYRNTKNILNAANAVIANNKNQKEKKLWTENKDGEKIQIYLAQDETDEGKFIVDIIQTDLEREKITEDNEAVGKLAKIDKEISKDLSAGRKITDSGLARDSASRLTRFKYNHYTVLYRTNAQSRAVENELINAGIPYKIVGGVRYYDRKEIKDVLSYLCLISNPNDIVRLERAVNAPARGIGPRTLQKIAALMRETHKDIIELIESGIYKQKISRQNNEMEAFARLLSEARVLLLDHKLSEVLEFIVKRSGLQEALKNNPEDADRLLNIKELFTVVKKFDDLKGIESLNNFLEEISLVSAQDEIEGQKDVVNLMTIHASKGLEFKNVFIAGMEESLFPHAQSAMEEAELEEERRLCYVAITRAIDRVFLLHADARKLYGNIQVNMPSRFLEEIPTELKEVSSYLDKICDKDTEKSSDMIIVDYDQDEKKKMEFFPEF